MKQSIPRRLFESLIVLIGVALLIFLMLRVVPGNPIEMMMREHANAGNAVLFSTHVLEVAEQLCDKILIINKGKIIREGTLEFLKLNNPGMTLEEIFVKLTGNTETR